MQNNFYLTILLLFFSVTTFSQASKGDIEIGVDVGYNYSLIFHDIGMPEPIDGFNVAGSLDYYFSDRWSIKGKVIYDEKGWDGTFYFGPYFIFQSNYDKIYRLNYITVPVMANYHFAKKRNWYLNFGPYVGFLLNAENTTNGLDIKNQFNTTDVGIAYGIGVKVPLNNNLKMFFEIDQQGGFRNIFKKEYNDFGNFYYNNEAAVNVRGSFNIGLLYQFNHNNTIQK